MLQSQLFTKTLRQAPKDEIFDNAKLLIRGGFVHKVMAGVYEFLPLGLRVLKKIENIIREEMNAIGGVELWLSTLQDQQVWRQTGRWDDQVVDIWFKTKLKNDQELGLATTHEEPLTYLMKNYVSSYRDLPIYVYQFQTKFRNELRAKSGLLRGREFLMKDLYSFCRSKVEHEEFYEQAKQAYYKIFNRVGLGAQTFLAFASGGTFSKYSHEFQTLCAVGEDTVFLDRKKKVAVNKEVLNDEVLADLGLKRSDLEEVRAIEVGNIFPLGTKFSDAFDLVYTDDQGQKQQVIMGSYGIGLSRLMAAIVETSHDEQGIIWPIAVSPFDLHLINIAEDSKAADKIYQTLQQQGISVLFDQRETTPGVKFTDADLIGIARRIVVSDKTLEKQSVELKLRNSDKIKIIKIKELPESLK